MANRSAITVNVAGQLRVSCLELNSVTPTGIGQIVDTYDPVDSTKGYKFIWNGATWKQLSDRSLLHVNSYGARPNDVAQASVTRQAIEACIADSVRYGTEVRLGGFDYYVDSPIIGITRFGGTPRDGLRIIGENAAGGAVPATRLVATFDDITQPLMWVSGSSNIFKHLSFYTTGVAQLYSFVEIGPRIAGQTGITANRFHDCLFQGSTDTRYKVLHGVTIAAITNPGGGSNVEDMLFEHCTFSWQHNICLYVAGGQPYNTQVINCGMSNFFGGGTPSGVGIQISETSSQVIVRGGNFTAFERAFNMTQSSHLVLDNIQSEQCKRLVDMNGLGSGADARVSMYSGRVSVFNAGAATANLTAADMRFIRTSGGGTINVTGTAFQPSGNNQAPGVRFDTQCPSHWRSVFFPNDHVFDNTQIQANEVGTPRVKPVVIEDCTTFGPDGVPIAYPDSPDGCRNSGRSLTFRDSVSSAVVPINDEIDAKYDVLATVVDSTGTPAAGSKRVSISGRTTTQFQMDLEAAPGSGNSVTVYWELRKRRDAAQLQVAGKVYGFAPTSGNFYRSLASQGEPGTASGFGFGALISIPTVSGASQDRVILSRISAGGGYQLVCHGAFASIDAVVRDGGGVARTSPSYTVLAGDAGKPLLLVAVLDNGSNLLRLYCKRLEVGAGSACTGYTAPTSTERTFLGCEAGSGYYATGVTVHGAFTFTGVPTLGNIQSYFDAVKSAADLPNTITGGTMTHVWSVRNDRRGNAPPLLNDLAGVAPLQRFNEPLIANTASPTWSW